MACTIIYSSFVSKIGDLCAYFLLLRPHCRRKRSMKCATWHFLFAAGNASLLLHFRFAFFLQHLYARTYTFRQTQAIVQIEILRPQPKRGALGSWHSRFGTRVVSNFVDIYLRLRRASGEAFSLPQSHFVCREGILACTSPTIRSEMPKSQATRASSYF